MKNSAPSAPIILNSDDASAVASSTDQGRRRETGMKTRYEQGIVTLLVISLLLLILSVLIMSAVPPVSRDALTHHLAVPKLWIEHGGIYEIPHLPFSYFPMNMDLLYVIPLLVGNDIAPKYIHYFFGLATSVLIFTYLRKRTPTAYSLFGALLFLSTPVVVKLSISVYVDLGLVFFAWASIYLLFKWDRSSFQIKYLLLSAICCGMGLGTKYNGLLVFFLLTLFVPYIFIGKYKASPAGVSLKAIISSVLFFSVALIVFSPWMIRNFKWTGNPVYPLYNQMFIGEAEPDFDAPITMKPWLQRKLIYQESMLETASIPIRIFFQGQDDNPKYFDGKLTPILLIFPILAFLGFKKRDTQWKSELIVMGGFSVLYLFYASFIVDMRIRYISPIIPPLVVLAVFGIRNAFSLLDHHIHVVKKSLGVCLVLIISIFLFQNGFYVRKLFLTVDPFSFLSGHTSRDDYIERFRPEYPVVQMANQLPVDNVKVLALFIGNRRYYFDKDVEFALEKFKHTADIPAPAGELAKELLKSEFTHVIVGAERFKTWAKNVFKNDQLTKINQFFNADCKLVYAKNGYALFEILHTTDH
jgi:hypothetical protein